MFYFYGVYEINSFFQYKYLVYFFVYDIEIIFFFFKFFEFNDRGFVVNKEKFNFLFKENVFVFKVINLMFGIGIEIWGFQLSQFNDI